MSLTLTWSFFYTLLVACQNPISQAQDCTLPETQDEFITEANELEETELAICLVPEADQSANLDFNVVLNDFNTEQYARMMDALNQLRIVINSKQFKERILNHQYQNKKTFVDNNELSNLEIYETIMLGAETLNPVPNQEIDINITLYYANNSTVGYTYPDTDKIWVNNKFFASYSLSKIAANIVHEWTHKLGFTHDFRRTQRRNFSVPYGVGTIVQELIEQMKPKEVQESI